MAAGPLLPAATAGRCSRTASPSSQPTSPRSGEPRVVGGRSENVDLRAVGAVGVPLACGVAVDAEAVVDLGVVAFAEQPGVLQRRLPAVHPGDQMMNLAPVGGGVAAGEHAVPVAVFDGLAERA